MHNTFCSWLGSCRCVQRCVECNLHARLSILIIYSIHDMFSHVLCSVFYDNTGSAVLLRNSLLYVSGDALFVKNKADIGAAINIQEGSRVSREMKKWQKIYKWHFILLGYVITPCLVQWHSSTHGFKSDLNSIAIATLILIPRFASYS